MDTLELIRTFREVANRGSFPGPRSAWMCRRPTSASTWPSWKPSSACGCSNRTTRTVSLTDAGALLLDRSAPLVEMIELTQAELTHRARQPSGRLRLTAPHGLSHTQLPELLAEFLTRYPEVSISLDLSTG